MCLRVIEDSLTWLGDNCRDVLPLLLDGFVVRDEHEAVSGDEGEGVMTGRVLKAVLVDDCGNVTR